MADFNLTQTDQEVQNILNDAQDAMGAGAQTTLTTDYIMLKGTNGRYHKILKDSFTEAVRNVLAGLLVNNDKGTTISQIAAIASGDFGSITPANLATVLGGIYKDLATNDNIITLPDGYYHTGSGAVVRSLVNAPEGANGECFLEIRSLYQNSHRVYYYYDSPRNALFKGGIRSSSAQSIEWYQMYDTSLLTNSALLSSLASAMGDRLLTGSVGVATRESDGYPRFRQPDQAASYTATAVGVWVSVGGKLIVVAKDQAASTKWATSNVSGGTTEKGREDALADMDGRANTTTILATLSGNAPAATYCHEYYPSNVESNDSNYGAGRWWLPSASELWMIWSHLIEINRIMVKIGGTELNRSQWYWSSTELSATTAWGLTFSTGNFYYYNNYKTLEASVRPVSAFY